VATIGTALAGLAPAGRGRLGDAPGPEAEPVGPDDTWPGRDAGGRAVPQPAARPGAEHAAASNTSARPAGTHPVTSAKLARTACARGRIDSPQGGKPRPV